LHVRLTTMLLGCVWSS